MSASASNQVSDLLRSRIIDGGLPPATGLREVRLAVELNVNRTPLREAIRQLTEEGFIEHSEQSGPRVATLSAEIVREVYEVREALEGMAARLAARLIDLDRVISLRNRMDELRAPVSAGVLSDTGDCVHDEIFAACGNSRLQHLMLIYRNKVTWIQGTSLRISGRLEETYHEHDSILRALECGDSDWAEAATRRHIRNTLDDMTKLLRSPSDSQASAPQMDLRPR